MTTIEFVPAVRAATRARIALTGPAGSGTTCTGLALGCAIAEHEGGRLAVVDTNRGKSKRLKGLNGWDFDVFCPQSFSPKSLVDILGVASGLGYPVVMLDSFSHYWMGVDGMLEQVDQHAKGGNNNAGWKEVRPDERRMLDALMSADFHTIVTMRVKTEYVIDRDERGKNASVKVGLKPEQRDGIEYEFDLVGNMDMNNNMTVSKSNIVPVPPNALFPKPTGDLALKVLAWLAAGERADGPAEYRAQALALDAVPELKELHDKVVAEGLGNAPVVDGDGNPTILSGLIRSRAHHVKQPA